MQRHDGDDEDVQHSGRMQSQDEKSYTPHSPSMALPPERSVGPCDSPGHPGHPQRWQHPQHLQQTHPQPPHIGSHNGVTDALGLQSFDVTSFENTIEQLKSPQPEQLSSHYRFICDQAYESVDGKFVR